MVAKLNPDWCADLYPKLTREHREAVAGADWTAGSIGGVDQMLRNIKIRQQFGESCCGEALSQMASAASAMLGNRVIYSALAAYYWGMVEEFKAKNNDALPRPGQLIDDGTYPYACELGWKKFGLPSEDTWPHDVMLLGKCPGWGAVAEGDSHNRFEMVALDGPFVVEDIKLNIRAGHPCGVTLPVDQEFFQHTGTSPMGPRVGQFRGLHRVALLGITADGLIIGVNSWGAQWGHNGLFFLTPEFVVQQGRDPTALIRADLLE
jgi:hypothetical protein